MSQETTRDSDDMFVERLNSAFLLLIGFLTLFTSVILLIYSATLIAYSQQVPANFLYTPIFAASLLVIGSGSFYLFRRRRKLRKKETSFF